MPKYGRRSYRKRGTRKRSGHGKSGWRKAKRRRTTRRRATNSRAINIQTSTFFPKKRTVLFQDTRCFTVTDNETHGGTGAPIPVLKILAINDPHGMFANADQGAWVASDFGEKGIGMPGLEKWITAQAGTGTGHYRLANCHSTVVTVSAVYIQEAGSDHMNEQAISKLILRKVTTVNDIATDTTLSGSLNAETECRKAYVKSQDMYQNITGVPKGATVVSKYRFRSMNAGPGRDSLNHFFSDAGPAEKDFLAIWILPTNKSWGAASERCGTFRVVVKVECVVELSEPNTSIAGGESTGLTMPLFSSAIPNIAGAALDAV